MGGKFVRYISPTERTSGRPPQWGYVCLSLCRAPTWIHPSNDLSSTSSIHFSFKVRECSDYKDEYKNCKSFKDRFQQYFVDGEFLDCNQWNQDYKSCCRLEEKDDWQAGVDLIVSEKRRRDARFGAHFANKVWTKRDAPPPDWNKPLPEWMQERYEHSYLTSKSKEMRGEAVAVEGKSSFCAIM